MVKKSIGFLLCVAIVLMVSPVFAEKGDGSDTPIMSRLATESYLVKSGDVLDVSVWKNPELDMTVIVDEEGKIDYPFLGVIDVEGKSVRDVKKVIAEGLNRDYIVNPRVDIMLNKKSLAFFIYGEVKRPGSYKYEGNLDVLKAITMAGGLTDFASQNVKVIRKEDDGTEVEIKVNIKKLMKPTNERDEYSVKPGDTIIVNRSWF